MKWSTPISGNPLYNHGMGFVWKYGSLQIHWWVVKIPIIHDV